MDATAHYFYMRKIPNQGVCGLDKMIFTWALCCDISEDDWDYPYGYRYCYEFFCDAIYALEHWDGKGHPPGPWIKRKGHNGDVINPEFAE